MGRLVIVCGVSALRLSLLVCAGLLCACDSAPAKSTDEKPADAKTADSKTADAKTADAKPDTKPDEAAPEKHFDITHDKSGVLARSAATLEASEALDGEALQNLSHHAEKLPSLQILCKKMKELGSVDDETACVAQSKHHLVLAGPELYAEWAACVMESTDAAGVKVCDEAEAEAEALLHEKPHGDGLSKEECTTVFDKFEKLSMDDAGEHAEHVKEVLEEVRDDVVASCVDQGTKDELECVEKSGSLKELDACASAHV